MSVAENPMDRRKIIVKGVNWIGDSVIATPAIRALRRAFPDAHITLLVRPAVAPVYEANPDVDRVWIAAENKSFSFFREIARRIADERFDLGISLPNSFGAALLLFLGRVKRRVGYKRDGRGVLLTDRVPATPEILRVHQVDYYLNLLRDFCDPAAQDSNLVLPAAPDALDQLRRRFQKLDIPLYGDRPLAALCPGAAFGSAKRWPAERFAAVADHLNAKWNARVLVLGAKSEWEVCEEICRKAQSPVLNLAGQNPLREMIALCPFLSVIVCNDSGPMHVAAACGTPLVAVFGPTDSTTTGPWSPNAVVVKNPCECPDVPCMRRECDFPTHACMLAVGADDVSAEVDKMMQKGRRSVAETT